MENSPVSFDESRLLFVGSTVVLIAQEINVPILSQLWLVKNGIVEESEFREGSLFTPNLVFVKAEKFELTALPDRIQLVFRELRGAEPSAYIERVAGGIVRALPHTPFSAMGLNFEFSCRPPAGELYSEWNRRTCLCPLVMGVPESHEDGARFGGYFSVDTLGYRARIDAKPACPASASFPSDNEFLQVAFNFHRDLPPDSAHSIIELLKDWHSVQSKAQKILDAMQL